MSMQVEDVIDVEKMEDIQDVDMTNAEATFDNPVIMKEFGNILDLVKIEDFLEIVPQGKLKRVKWVPIFDCLKQGIFNEMIEELASMWKAENMPEKLELLEKQKEKFADVNEDQVLWRPQLGDVKAQLRTSDVANLKKQKSLLEALAKDYEARVDSLKTMLVAKREYLRVLQRDINKYERKNEELITKLNEQLENHGSLVKIINPDKISIDEITWTDKDMEIIEKS